MSHHSFRILGGLVAAGVMSLATVPASAQTFDNAGVVRVTDQPAANLAPIPEGMATPAASCPSCPGGNAGYASVAGCPCPHGCTGPCIHNCRCTRHVAQVLDWFNPWGMYTFSPDHGWAPPIKRPIYRSQVVYQKGFPDAWMGGAGAEMPQQRLPSVYMPTDTTQLGYYYQHAPYWLPKPNAIPPAPRPSDWHTSMCQAELQGHHPAGVILGRAPVLTPAPVWEGAGSSICPPPAETPIEPSPVEALERSAISPNLFPIE